jgi:tryptophan halogenase
LLGDALKVPFESYSDILPNNKAWACQVPYLDKEKEIEPFTNCTAIENGWCWNTPTWERIGTGYVFSDKYVSKEQALEEFKNYLRSDKMAVHDENRDVESYTYRFLKFRVGIHRRTFVKNVVAIGLSAGFIEPLESNGLFTVHEFLDKLVKTLERGTLTQWDRDAYNSMTRIQYLSFKEFVAQHYALTNRDDTQYWRDITEKTFQPKIPSLEPSMVTGFNELANVHINSKMYNQFSGTHCISTGLNYLPVTANTIERWNNYHGIDHYKECKNTWNTWDIFRKIWQEEADVSPTMYQWLKENIHKE